MKVKKAIKITLIVGLILAIFMLTFTLWFVISAIREVEDINVSLVKDAVASCQIFGSNGDNITNNDNLNNTYVLLEDINEDTIDAFLSIEDKKFYEHDGLNYPRIAKAILTNIVDGRYSQGASTISQQLVKNKYLSNEKTLSRKVKEIYLTKKLESVAEKDVILETYLNTIYYGNGAYGIGNASIRFFGKKPSELTLSESCILAGAVNYPARYSPINNLEKSIERRDLVLAEMLKDGRITEEEYNSAIAEDVVLNPTAITGVSGLDLYTRNVLREASDILGISEEEIFHRNYQIFTYQDIEIQNALDSIIYNDKYYDKNTYGNIADSLSIILDNKSGGVCAVSGRSEYDLVNFRRQPGSLIKPIVVYTPAFEEGLIYPCSEMLDEKTSFDGYTPQNVGNVYYGYTSIRDCVAKSLNIPAVKLCEELTVDKCKEYGSRCGLEFDDNDTGLAVALGGLTKGFTLQDITESYLPFTNNGMFKNSRYISKIISPYNLTIYMDKMSEIEYCSQESAYLMTESLQYSTRYGTSKKLANCAYDIAGKTGTVNVKNSNSNTDAYSLAYTSSHTMSVWLGNYSMDEKFNLNGSNNGGTYATEMIRDAFDKIYLDNIPDNFEVSDGIITMPIDIIELENNHEIFVALNLPERYQKMEIFSSNNIPPLSSNNLDNINDVTFSVFSSDNCIEVTVDCKEYLNYSLYRYMGNSSPLLLKSISNYSGKYTFEDYSINYNEKYNYYIVCTSPYSSSSSTSVIKFATVSKDYSQLINSQDNTSWIFG